MATTALDQNKALVREYYQVLENGAFDRIPEFFADDFTVDMMQLTEGGSEEAGVETVVERTRETFDTFPDATIEIEEMAAEGDWVLCRTTLTGTHEGEFLGIEPTGEEITMQTHWSFRIEDGEFVETHGSGSQLWVLGQMGVDLPIED